MLVLTRSLRTVVAVVVATFVIPNGAFGQPSFQGVGDLPGGDFFSGFGDVSGDGHTVVGVSETGQGQEAFRWTSSEGIIGIGDLPGGTFSSWANAASFDGSVIVGFGNRVQDPVFGFDVAFEAFRWTQAGGFTALGDLPGGTGVSFAASVSGDGTVIAGTGNIVLDPFGFQVSGEMFRWTEAGGMEGLGDLPGGSESSWGGRVSGDGSTIVGTGNFTFNPKAGGQIGEAFRWTESGGMQGLGFLPGPRLFSTATGVSSGGAVIAGWGQTNSPTFEAFRWTQADGLIGLGIPAGFDGTAAFDISANGTAIVGQALSLTVPSEATIWDATNGIRLLSDVLTNEFGIDLTGWQLFIALGISDDGTVIVGSGSNPTGDFEVWVASGPFVIASCLADLNGDGVVGPFDLAVLLGAWGPCAECPADFSGDGVIGPLDLATLLGAWGPCP